jgi:hypothetical protein
MTKVLLAHPGTQHAPALARELDRRGLLGEFRTGFALDEKGLLAHIASRHANVPGAKSLRNRIVRGVASDRIHSAPWHEILALYQIRRGRDSVEALHERNRRFQEGIPETSIRMADCIIGFDTSSWILAKRARDLGKPLWLERTINHPRQWQDAQIALHRRYPQWQEAPAPRLPELVKAEEAEHQMAHQILVGSSFVARTLAFRGNHLPHRVQREEGALVNRARFDFFLQVRSEPARESPCFLKRGKASATGRWRRNFGWWDRCLIRCAA